MDLAAARALFGDKVSVPEGVVELVWSSNFPSTLCVKQPTDSCDFAFVHCSHLDEAPVTAINW